MPWIISACVVVLWVLGFSLHVAGNLIHLLVVIALLVLVVHLVAGRSAV
jgi:Family of unknown function (DUF5670)